ncbi:retrovirus-related pol polyprotein from transposon TNT 1-94 [Tanacetum coccineum]
MSTSKTYQQSLADAGSETRPPMLERGSYIPWASRFKRFLNRKRENRKWLLKALEDGPYVFRNITPTGSTIPRLQEVEDLQGDDLLYYDAEMELMNMILLSIPNEIYNSVDSCKTAKEMWARVERLMRGTIQNQVDRETRFTNEFDQFVAEPGESLVSVYNRFAQLMNDLERNNMKFPTVSVNTKFLNSLQPEWLKYVTQVRLAKQLTVDSFDDLFDYLSQFEKLVNASRAKKLEKSHDPLALVAHTGSSSRNTSSYYVTHPSSVVDYDEEYEQDDVHNHSEDPLASAMLLLAKAITQNFSNPTNNRLRASSNTRNQAVVQGDRVNIQSRNSGNVGRNNRRAYVQEEVVEGMNATNETANVQRIVRTPTPGNTSTGQCYNCGGKGHYARNCPKPRVRDSKYFMEQMLLAKQDEAGVILTDEQNDFLFADASRMEEIEELSANICLMARIQPADQNSDDEPSYESAFICALETLAKNAYAEAAKQQRFAQKVQQQNMTLTSQIEMYMERNQVLENITKDNNYLKEFLEADERAKRVQKQADSQLTVKGQNLFQRDIKEMKDVFEQNDVYLDEIERQNDLLKDQLLEASLKHDIELCALLNHECVDESLHDELEQKLEDENVSLDFKVQSFIKERDNAKMEYKKLFDSIKKKQSKTQKEMDELIAYVSEKTFAYGAIRTENQNLLVTISELKARMKNGENGRFLYSRFVLWFCLDMFGSKHMMGDRALLRNFVEKFMGTVRFGNDNFAAITGYDLEVAFRSKTCYVRNLEGDDLLTGGRDSNLYTISISDMAASSPICLMSKATSTKSWLWHRRLSHLNFGTINDLTKLDLVDGLPKFKYGKDHLCSACERGKSKKASHPPKLIPSDYSKLELLHMDLCGPMRVVSVNEKKYLLVIVDDFSRFTWVYFLRSKDKTPEIIKKFIAQAQLNYKAKVCKIRTDNGTEFKNATLKAHYEKIGIMQQFSIARTPQQNGVVERRNRTLVEAARTMLIFSRLSEFLWAKAVATSCFTQNRSIINIQYNKTPYELLRGRKPNVEYFHVFGSLCYPTNDRDNLGKMKLKADIRVVYGLFINIKRFFLTL